MIGGGGLGCVVELEGDAGWKEAAEKKLDVVEGKVP